MRAPGILKCIGFLTVLYLMAASPRAMAAGHDFISEVRQIFRIAACGGGDIPVGFDRAVIDEHCRRMGQMTDQYRKAFIDKAAPFMARLRPGGIPRKVFVPFGGGDLLPAMIMYPDASEYITISLESSGDPRRMEKATPAQLRRALEMFRSNAGYMLLTNDNSNESVRNMDRGAVPNQLSFSLAALAVLGYEPVSLRYFRIENDGNIHYLTLEEISSLENVKGQRLKGTWIDTDFSMAFRNMELAFRKKGGGSTIIHRHIAYNLDNRHFAGSPLQKYLEGMGKISVMIKGASYLPWFDSFSAVREYTLSHMVYGVSDATGILPRHASPAGFIQETYGKFNGAFLDNDGGADTAALRALFQSQPYREIPFRFGYSDTRRANHLIITKKK